MRTTFKPSTRIRLSQIDPHADSGYDNTKAAEISADNVKAIDELSYRLYAEGKRAVLIVLQGMDTSGKDGTIRHVASINPQNCSVVSFKVPTAEEAAHDFLWRIHQRVPRHGQITIFNRSHYEDVLAVRVHKLVPEAVWRGRYKEINQFERTLTKAGITILKFFLHISKSEQRERMQARLDDPTKRWKFGDADLKERQLWNEYQGAYEDALTECNTDDAPWHVIPADRKWHRDLLVGGVLRETLEKMNPQFPPAQKGIRKMVIR